MSDARYRESIDLLRNGLANLLSQVSLKTSRPCSCHTELLLNPITLRLSEDDSDSDKPRRTFFGVNSFGAFTIYDKGFQLQEGTTDDIFQDEDNVHRASSVLLYNTALVHHLLGLQGPNQQRHLKKALKLYEMAIDVLHNCKKHNDVDKMITLAIFNNKGHVYCQFSELSQVQVCIDWLKSILDCCCEEADELLHFRLTALLWNGRMYPSMAPAA